MQLTHTEILYYAFLQGLVGALNPCGFAMLPAYLSLVVLGDDTTQAGRQSLFSAVRALAATAAMSLGFVVVFGCFGFASDSIAWEMQRSLPVATALIGAAMVLLGLWFMVRLLRGGDAMIRLPRWSRGTPTTRLSSMFGYGLAYAVSSLSCGFGSFVTVISLTFQAGASNLGLLSCLAYAGGMTAVVGSLAVSAALAHNVIATGLRKLLPHISKVSAVLVMLTGLYIAYYGLYEYRLLREDGDQGSQIIAGALAVQGWLTAAVDAFSPWEWVAILCFLLFLAGVWTAFVRLWRPRQVFAEPAAPGP
ncbi:cytochrome c biogenesis protein transmembrane region [Segniliparus rotundus DSM 44985]|uniref:Cytochrome c biogenesis protein transmembrane region n=1 Tax=Segniliparus rotundus (strain ATCC BAA-972 / CDC 1076 / CIP 108378 / DSM 44985 / JCM 13578) TaxID=640132 RepID=D6ZFL8_SEGRD|nr:cytochrome c biogenesis protein CcdA [Segniliparus rotundus]ADG97742.1 cytochrome c biogenesis protein transmembrane region [Segniliparus rotundus DSM 44985]